MIHEITGKDNKTLKLIRSLKKKSARRENNCFIAEGVRLVEEALRFAADEVRCIVVSDEFLKKDIELLEEAKTSNVNIYTVKNSVFNEISDTDTPQGIMAVMKMKNVEPELSGLACNTSCVAVLDGVSEPGNMGTIIRTAEALGFDGIYLMKGCTDIYSPKTVRATMGSVFRMKFKTECMAEDILKLKENGFQVIATTPWGDTEMEKFHSSECKAVVIGNEAHGVSDELIEISDIRMKIRMDGLAESLNAAVAAGIAMHWLKNCQG